MYRWNFQFDVLSVFMFDGIGYIDDKTSFIVEFTKAVGIQVQNVKEGKPMTKIYFDKLTDYIRALQAFGKSKTRIRIWIYIQ